MKDVQRWLKNGLIDENLAHILEDDLQKKSAKRQKIAMQIVLYTVGIIFLGTGVITFIAANDWILVFLVAFPLIQIFILFTLAVYSLWGGYKLGYSNGKFPRLGGALVFLSSILIGACYILIGQIYHWSYNATLILTLWFVSIFPLAFMFKSNSVNRLSVVLFLILFPYYYYELNIDTNEVWTIFMPFSLFAVLYTFANIPVIREKYNSFSLSYKIIALIPLFFTFLILIFSMEESYHLQDIHYMIMPFLVIVFNLINFYTAKNKDFLQLHEVIFIVVLMSFLELLLLLESINLTAASVIVYLLAAWVISECIYWGYKFEEVSLVNLGNIFLIVYLMSLYCLYGWSYLDKTVFFLLGGVGLVTLGILLEKEKNKRLGIKIDIKSYFTKNKTGGKTD